MYGIVYPGPSKLAVLFWVLQIMLNPVEEQTGFPNLLIYHPHGWRADVFLLTDSANPYIIPLPSR
jgi:hypothetical protein